MFGHVSKSSNNHGFTKLGVVFLGYQEGLREAVEVQRLDGAHILDS